MPRRTTRLTDKQRADICAILGAGGPLPVAAAYAGCDVPAIERAAERSAAFRDQLSQAEARCEVKLLAYVQEAAGRKQQWRAAAWLLERKYPQRYAPRRPDAVTLDQVSQLLSQLCEIVLAEVPAAFHEKLLLRMRELSAEAQRVAGKAPARATAGNTPRTHALPPPK